MVIPCVASSATLKDNIFVNTLDNITACGNITSDISDHFSQLCILKSARNKTKAKNLKMRDCSNFSSEVFGQCYKQYSCTDNKSIHIDRSLS